MLRHANLLLLLLSATLATASPGPAGDGGGDYDYADCSEVEVPVCGADGVTYPNRCYQHLAHFLE